MFTDAENRNNPDQEFASAPPPPPPPPPPVPLENVNVVASSWRQKTPEHTQFETDLTNLRTNGADRVFLNNLIDLRLPIVRAAVATAKSNVTASELRIASLTRERDTALIRSRDHVSESEKIQSLLANSEMQQLFAQKPRLRDTYNQKNIDLREAIRTIGSLDGDSGEVYNLTQRLLGEERNKIQLDKVCGAESKFLTYLLAEKKRNAASSGQIFTRLASTSNIDPYEFELRENLEFFRAVAGKNGGSAYTLVEVAKLIDALIPEDQQNDLMITFEMHYQTLNAIFQSAFATNRGPLCPAPRARIATILGYDIVQKYAERVAAEQARVAAERAQSSQNIQEPVLDNNSNASSSLASSSNASSNEIDLQERLNREMAAKLEAIREKQAAEAKAAQLEAENRALQEQANASSSSSRSRVVAPVGKRGGKGD
jgi:hypothetical protein